MGRYNTLAVSYVEIGSTASARAAGAAATRKHAKYDTISVTHIFVPVAVETLGPFCHEGLTLFRKSVFVSLQYLTILENPVFYFREFQS